MGDELRAVVAADKRRCRIEAGQIVQYRYHVLGLAAPTHTNGQAEAAVPVDLVEELEPPSVGGRVELDIHGPGMVRVFGLVAPH